LKSNASNGFKHRSGVEFFAISLDFSGFDGGLSSRGCNVDERKQLFVMVITFLY
jgi:hypothetical protein